MTERFTETISTGIVMDTVTGKEYNCEMRIDDDFLNLVNTIAENNEELKKRNENQHNQLTELWQIIEEENWEKLIAMKKQLKEDEERLQQEWKCYE